MTELEQLIARHCAGPGSSTVFVLALFIGFCVLFGFTKLKRTAGGSARVVKSLDELLSHRPMDYLQPMRPAGPPTSSARRNSWSPLHVIDP